MTHTFKVEEKMFFVLTQGLFDAKFDELWNRTLQDSYFVLTDSHTFFASWLVKRADNTEVCIGSDD